IVWGGDVGLALATKATGGRYDPSHDTWTPTSVGTVPLGRNYPTVLWTGSEMIIWGGEFSTGSRYDPATDTWTPTATSGTPAGNHGNTPVWTGTEMLVFG